MAGTTSARAIVSRGPLADGLWSLEDVTVRPIKDDELLVEIIASGICHTDILIGGLKDGPGVCYPRVLGHEGSGYVRQVGSKVTVAKPGDPVLLSFASCGKCQICDDGHPAHCVEFNPANFGGNFCYSASTAATNGSTAESEPSIFGSFFGQSSFASTTIVTERSVVNVKGLVESDDELKLFAPLGCGIQTGSGTIINVAEARESDSVVVLGLGGVGLSAIMGARIRGCKRIIGIDRVASRLELAKELGATHVIDTSKLEKLEDVVQAVREMTDGLGAHVSVDTTGFLPLIRQAVEFTRLKGKIIQVGSAPFDATLDLPIFGFMVSGKQYIGAVEGDSKPEEYVPQMIQWYREGRFPVDRLVKLMKAEEWNQAIEEMHDGSTIKPVITW